MNKGYRSLLVLMFILFEVLYVLSILANVTAAPAYVEQNGEMILYGFIVFNVVIVSSLIF